ncbi:imidazolonepropionase [Lentzea sp. NBRC 105346]|uniref:amidohydrolase family protein n=1 Tax=Lentzea sp. NBRC 105346 TaxID=3032205 RepID=UPI00249FD425|nr:amidohydrolase family protein [Lentzea sp. NBRC 105346]GLZ33777.1 imidazolonepropionase [Lentzea sp. NBRC 105346]
MCFAHAVASSGVTRRSVLAAGLALPVLSAGTAVAAEKPPFVIAGVRIFDGKRVVPCGHVVVAGGRIVAVHHGGRVPGGFEVQDFSGCTLLPGMIDGHVHHTAPARTDAPRFGVTTELDMVSDPAWHGPYREQRVSYAPTALSDLWTAGWWATVPGGWGTDSGLPIPVFKPGDDAAAFVAARRVEGSDHLKLALEDRNLANGTPIPVLSAAQTRALVAAAARSGMPAVAHATRQELARVALEAGVNGLVHLFTDADVAPDVIRTALRANAFVTPTLTLWSAFDSAENPASAAVVRDPRVAPLLSAKQRGFLETPWGFARPGVLAQALRNVLALHRAGVPITTGTDAGIPGVAHGVSLLVELELLVRAGLSPVAALRAATSTPASLWGLADRGRIRSGLRADLVLVEGDPTSDISAMRGITRVWRNGSLVNRVP